MALWSSSELITRDKLNQKNIFVSATEPTSMFAGQVWCNSTTNEIKMRNGDNNAWISIVNTSYNLSTLTTSPSVEGTKVTGTAGENLVTGNVVYLKTDGKWYKALATSSNTTTLLGMVSSTININTTGTILLIGQMRYDSWSWATAGLLLYVSPTTGGLLTITAPSSTTQIVQLVGITSGTNTIIIIPNLGTLTLV